MRLIRILVFLAVCSFSVETALAATYYVRTGASGVNNGQDWSNAYSSLPSSLERGATYYIADGSYGQYTFDDNVSGTSLITIKKAIPSDHGTDTGWSNDYGDGQAVLGSLFFNTGYYYLDGQTGGGPSNWTGNLGIKSGRINGRNGGSKAGLTFRHMDIDGGTTTSNGNRPVDIANIDGITFSYCYIHNAGDDVFTLIDISDLTVEYSKMAYSFESATYHPDLAQGYGGPYSNLIWRYNYIYDVDATYLWGVHRNNTATNYEIYGNIIVFTSRSNTTDGIVGDLDGQGTINNLKFFNNTITGDFNYNVGFGPIAGSNNIARNNLWVRLSGSGFGNINSVTHDHNTFYNFSHSGEENLSGDPFNNSGNEVFTLTEGTTAGVALSSPYNVDMYGNIRGEDGVWDRGAFEFDSATSGSRPSAPTGLTVVSSTP